MVEANLGLVGWTVTRFYPRARTNRDEHDDMYAAGTLGLIRAVQKFEPERGYRFATYATGWIRASIQRWVTQDANARRAASRGEDLPLTVSLDAPITSGDGEPWQLADRLADPGVDVDREVGTIDAVGLVASRLNALIETDVDRAIACLLIDKAWGLLVPSYVELAEAHGCDYDTVRARRARLIKGLRCDEIRGALEAAS